MFSYLNAKFMVLPPGAIFNDYQILFNLTSNIEYKAWEPDPELSRII